MQKRGVRAGAGRKRGSWKGRGGRVPGALLLAAACLTAALLAGCSGGGRGAESGEGALPTDGVEGQPVRVACRLVDGAQEGSLLLAELEEAPAGCEGAQCGGGGVYRLAVGQTPVLVDGKAAGPEALQDGMVVEVLFDGTVRETWPAGLNGVQEIRGWGPGSRQCPGGGCYDLCGLYLQVLDDLWQQDPGLNADIRIAGVDLSAAPGPLAESEQRAVAWRFGELHGVEVVQGNWDWLRAEGYLTPWGEGPQGADSEAGDAQGAAAEEPLLCWEDGCLFSITAPEMAAEEGPEGETDAPVSFGLPVLRFNAQKWRSPLGAYALRDCTAVFSEMGGWSGYQARYAAIS